MHNKWLRYSVGLNFAFAAIGAGVAFAADAPAVPAAVPAATPSAATQPPEEITVTATKRKVALKNVDASISVLSADLIKTADIKSLNDAATLVPNFQFALDYRVGVPYLTMRGVPTAQGGEPPVAVIVDGAQAPGLEFIDQDLINIQDVEVLRGPQGALYGRGAIAGAIIINTQKPTNDLSGELIADYGSGNSNRVVGTIAGPIVQDKLWYRITAQERYSSGLIENVGIHQKGDSIRERIGRLELLAQPDDDTTIDFKASHTTATNGSNVVGIVPQPEITNPSIYPDTNVPDFENRIIDMYSLKIDRALPYGTLTSVSQYAYSYEHMFADGDYSPAPALLQVSGNQSRAVNQDLRFTSPDDQAFKWLVGFFYQRRDDRAPGYSYFDPAGNLCCGTFNNIDQIFFSTAYAGYGQASYDFGAGITLTAAFRFDVDERYDNDRLTPGSEVRHTFYSGQPQITLSRRWTDDLMTYVTFGKGFRSGSFNPYPDTINLGVPRLFPQETTKNYEGGIKSQWFDHKLNVNAAVFHTDFTNQQFYFVNLEPQSRDIVTFPSTSLNGGELEVTYTPITDLLIGANLGVTDGIITKANLPMYDGNHSPLVNRYTLNVSIQYRRPINDELNWLARVEWNKMGNIYYNQTGQDSMGPQDFVNARLGLEAENWTISLIGKNLSNNRSPANYFPNIAGPGVGATILREPVSFTVEASYKY